MNTSRKFGLSGNLLKIIACISMLVDHVGVFLFPNLPVLRIIGRLAFPIFAFMIYEGCRYTRNRWRYLGGIFILGIITSIVCTVANGYHYFTVLITFSCSIVLIYLLQLALSVKKISGKILVALLFGVSVGLMYIFTQSVKVEFGLSGILLPLFPTAAHMIFKDGKTPMIFNSAFFAFAAALVIHALIRKGFQPYALLALIPLALYNGERGIRIPKYTFYVFYPVHMAVIYLISLLPMFK